MEEVKQTKMEVAIKDTKLRLKNTEEQLQLLIRQSDVLKEQLRTLEIINEDKNLI